MSIFDWSGTSKKADIVECHFCLQKCRLQSFKGKAVLAQDDQVPVIAGSPFHFECPACETWNIRDSKTGELLDTPSTAITTTAYTNTSRISRRLRQLDTTPRPFCTHCLTNQSLQVQLLAGYLPSKTSEEDDERLLRRLPAYKESLDTRYPVVCGNCQGHVEEIIKERNWKAKARTVGGWLRNTAKIKQNTSADGNGDISATQVTHHPLWLWSCKGVCWMLLYVYSALLPLLEHQIIPLPRNSTLQHISIARHSVPGAVAATLLASSTIFYSFWDPTYKARMSRAQNAEIKGSRRWMILQTILLLGRVIRFMVPSNIDSHRPYEYILATAHLTALLLRDRITYVEGPRRIKLIEHPKKSPSSSPISRKFPYANKAVVQVDDSGTKIASSIPANPSFGRVSMGSTPPVSRMYRRHGFGHAADDDDDDMHEDEHEATSTTQANDNGMDWQPFDALDANDQGNGHSTVSSATTDEDENQGIHLRPAVFNPEDDWNLAAYGMKGLDGLFAKGVSLRDTRFDDLKVPADKGSFSNRTLILSLCLVSLLLLGFASSLWLQRIQQGLLWQSAPRWTKMCWQYRV